MKTINAQLNHNRWIAVCPTCAEGGQTSAALVTPGELFICASEYPDILATMQVPHRKRKGAFVVVADDDARDEARLAAIEQGAAYEVIFPADKKEIEAALSKRPAAARNWTPGFSVDDLLRENAERGL